MAEGSGSGLLGLLAFMPRVDRWHAKELFVVRRKWWERWVNFFFVESNSLLHPCEEWTRVGFVDEGDFLIGGTASLRGGVLDFF